VNPAGSRFGIKSRLVLAVMVALVPLALFSALQINAHAQFLKETWQKEAKLIADLVATDTDQQMRDHFKLATRLAHRPDAKPDTTLACNTIMAEFRRSNLDYKGAGFIDDKGIHRCTSHAGNEPPPPADFSQIHWFTKAQKVRDPFVSQPYIGLTRKQWVLLVVAPIRDANDHFRGTINLPLDVASLRPRFNGQIEQAASVLLVDDAGRVISHATDQSTFTLGDDVAAQSMVRQVLAGETLFREVDPHGRRVLVAASHVPSTDWHAISYIPSAVTWPPIRKEIERNILFWLGLLLASLAVALLISRQITRPILALADFARRHCDDRLGERAKPTGPPELADLAHRLNQMLDYQELCDAELRISASAFEAQEGILVTDADHKILRVNAAFTQITGYSEQEAIGKTPTLLNSGRHDRAFFQSLHQQLHERGYWRGEIWNRRKNGTIYPQYMSIATIRNPKGEADGYVAVFADITQTKETEQRLHFLVHHDALTELPNRLLLNARLELATQRAKRTRQKFAVLFLDIDRFKGINDSLGHLAGDSLLQEVANRLTSRFREQDMVARISGDEFVILLEELEDDAAAEKAACKALDAFSEPFDISNTQVRVTASCGISIYPDHASDMEGLLTAADAAMYQSKQDGRNNYHVYGAGDDSGQLTRAEIEVELRSALPRSEFSLVYQPQVSTQSRRLVGLEALIRWNHPRYGLISPADFIPIAEEAGLIREIGIWVLSEATRQAHQWIDQGLDFGRVAVNVSGAELRTPDFESILGRVIDDLGLPAERLEIEITEHFAMRRDQLAIDRLLAVRKMGITVAVDDFGTGYSSLAHLRELPVDKLKIDQSFIRDTPDDVSASAIVESVVAMGKILDLCVIAEGVECQAQMEMLTRIECPEVQGYFISHPMEPAKLATWLDDWMAGRHQNKKRI
jgi:diguanylate cyclase (GGDEF)-like protein/PAS domain S-box-containing protein